MASPPHVVIIGAGIVGVNVADELASRGWNNITVVEQGPLHLPGGSTSCSPGLVFQTMASKTLSFFAKYTVEKLLSLEQPCYEQVGGLEIATSQDKLDDLKLKQGWATSWNIDSRILSPEECVQMYPLLAQDQIAGGLYVPSDGVVSALDAVEILMKRTRELGVRYIGHTRIVNVETVDDRVTGVVTPSGTIAADFVISCSGFWAADVGSLVPHPIPVLPLSHLYAQTASIPELDDGRMLPALRIHGQDLYYRTHGSQLGIGYYGHRPMPAHTPLAEPRKIATQDNMPSKLGFSRKDFDPGWTKSRDLMPALQNSKLGGGFSGIFSFTPDGFPLLGQSPKLDNFYVAEGVWMSHSAGAARAIAEILTDGASKLDLTECDLVRFNEVQLAQAHLRETGKRSCVEVYDIKHPLAPRDSPRNLRVSPFFARQKELGANFNEWDAWEYPTWYKSNERFLEGIPAGWLHPEHDARTSEYESPIVAVEAWKTRTAVAMYDMTLLPRIEVAGPGALALLQRVTTGDVSKKPGAITYALMLNNRGGICSDVTVARLDDKLFQVGANTPIDTVYLQRQARDQMRTNPSEWVTIRETTSGTCCIGLWGPYSRDVLHAVTSDDFSNKGLRFFRVKRSIIAGIPVTIMRISYVGELGWEIYTTADFGLRLWDTLWEAGERYGIIAAGKAAFNSLRMEKGFKYCGHDMHAEHNPYEAGLGFAVKKSKGDFVGRAALEGMSEKTATRKACCLTVDDGKTVVLGHEPVYYRGKVEGYVTSSAYGYTVQKPIIFCYLPASATEGEQVEVDYRGKRIRATMTAEPLFDPQMTRLKNTSARPAALCN